MLFKKKIPVEFSSVFLAWVALSMTAGMFACSGKSVQENDPAALYNDAEEEIQSDHYQIAIDKLRVIRNKFPYSKYSVDAQLRIADVYFLQENYIEAAAAYENFRDLHPKHEKVPYAMFRIGKSYFKDLPSNVARDQTSAQKAAEAYQEFLHRFPAAPESSEARDDLASSRKSLADKELYIGNFYYKRDFYDSAKSRYEKILVLFPETDAAKKAKDTLDKIADYEEKHPKKADESKESSANG